MDSRDRSTLRDAVGGAAGDLGRAAQVARDSIASALFGEPTVRIVDGRYEIRRKLGEGGQGEVWGAFDVRLAREVAIKTHRVAHDAARAWTAAWLKREAQLLGRVPHPNVVAVFDVGLAPASAFGGVDDIWVIYLVLELVRGDNLLAWATAARRDPQRITAMLVDVAHGLQAVHTAGLVHCDVKPGNILVGADGTAKLGDFGLAHAQREQVRRGVAPDDAAAGSELDTRAGSEVTPFGGTPQYMPPEQFAGGHLDGRADQYALAATWFHAVFGRLPHSGATRLALIAAKQDGAPPRPSSAMSRSSYAALARALAPDPRDRFTSIDAFAKAMTRGPGRMRAGLVVAGAAAAIVLPLLAGRASVTEGCEPTRLADAVPGAAIEVPAGTSAYEQQLAVRIVDAESAHARAGVLARREACALVPPPPERLACLSSVDAIASAATAPRSLRGRRALEEAVSVASALPDPAACDGSGALASLVTADVTAIATDLDLGRTLTLQAEQAIADGRWQDAVDLTQTPLSPATSIVLRGELELSRAFALAELNHHDEAIATYRAVWDRSIDRGIGIDAVRAAAGLARVIGGALQDTDAAMAWIARGRAELDRFGESPLIDADLRASAAAVAFVRGDLERAHVEISAAVDLLARDPEREQARWALEENLALTELQSGDLEAAGRRFDAVIQWRQTNLGAMHPSLASALLNSSFVADERGDSVAATTLLGRALAIAEASDPVNEVDIAKISAALAGHAVVAGKTDVALGHLQRVAEIWSRLLPPDHPNVAKIAFMRIDALIQADRFEEADVVAHAARDRIAAITDAGSEQAMNLELVLARLDGLRGRGESALRRYRALFDDAVARDLAADERGLWCIQAAAIAGKMGDLDQASEWTVRAEAEIAAGRSSADLQQGIDELRTALDAARRDEMTARRDASTARPDAITARRAGG